MLLKQYTFLLVELYCLRMVNIFCSMYSRALFLILLSRKRNQSGWVVVRRCLCLKVLKGVLLMYRWCNIDDFRKLPCSIWNCYVIVKAKSNVSVVFKSLIICWVCMCYQSYLVSLILNKLMLLKQFVKTFSFGSFLLLKVYS